jgi:Uma2 family endonuclease
MATATAATPLLTAEEFGRRPDPGHPEELVRGRIVRMPPPKPRHGEVCFNVGFHLRLHVQDRDLGRILSNDSGVITQRGPDTLRGADIAYYSYVRVPKGPLPDGYLDVAPDLVAEVLSPDDRWPKVLEKVAEYLNAGVLVVVVLDPERRTVHAFSQDDPVRTLTESDELTLPGVLDDFRIAIGRFFE